MLVTTLSQILSRLLQPIINIIDCVDDDHRHQHDHVIVDHDDHLERNQASLLPDEGAQGAADAEDGKTKEETNPDNDYDLDDDDLDDDDDDDDDRQAEEETNPGDHF